MSKICIVNNYANVKMKLCDVPCKPIKSSLLVTQLTFVVVVSRTTGRMRLKYGTVYRPTKDAIIK